MRDYLPPYARYIWRVTDLATSHRTLLLSNHATDGLSLDVHALLSLHILVTT